MRVLYTLTIFVGSAMLFLIQPMIAKLILPRFGGSAQVWTASMLFFQAVLLLGYMYAHFSMKKWGPKQRWIHLGVLIVAGLVSLPFRLADGFAARGANDPTFALLALLALAVGPAFFAVSAGAPTLQRWFANTSDPAAKDPYFLYSASNLGSMLALLGYPFLMEPAMRLADQTQVWAIGFGVLVVLVFLCALVPQEAHQQVEEEPPAAIAPKSRWRWVALGAVPSSMMLGVTAYLSTNVSPGPMMWVVPLALYLLSFILAFATKPILTTKILIRIVSILALALVVIMVNEAHQMNLIWLHLVTFFFIAWMCHAQLAEERPDRRQLTEFYLWMSVGGVVGGAFNALLAPIAFNNLYEYPIAVVAALILRKNLVPRAEGPFRWLDAAYPLFVGGVTAGLIVYWRQNNLDYGPMRTLVVVGIPTILPYIMVDRSIRYGLSVGAALLVSLSFESSATGRVLSIERSFYGIHRVTTDGKFHKMVHGNTVHGQQWIDETKRDRPLTYYHRTGPVGFTMNTLAGDPRLKTVAFVGLGVGSMAAYGTPGQRINYYEIDPSVERMARDTRLFWFLEDCKADLKVILGDARVMLEEAPDGQYGLIALDAFSSDAIPVHLLTKEAFELYFRKMQPNGVLAVHISNRYLRLDDVVSSIADSMGMSSLLAYDVTTDDEREDGKTASKWMIVSRDEAILKEFLKSSMWEKVETRPGFRMWTDDYSNLLSVWVRED